MGGLGDVEAGVAGGGVGLGLDVVVGWCDGWSSNGGGGVDGLGLGDVGLLVGDWLRWWDLCRETFRQQVKVKKW